MVPADVQTIYNLSPLYRQNIYGQGQTIVVVEDSMPSSTDPTTYQNTFNLGVYGGSWSNTHPNAGDNCTAPASHSSDEGEADIDVEICAGGGAWGNRSGGLVQRYFNLRRPDRP